jgi:hypothetical protein
VGALGLGRCVVARDRGRSRRNSRQTFFTRPHARAFTHPHNRSVTAHSIGHTGRAARSRSCSHGNSHAYHLANTRRANADTDTARRWGNSRTDIHADSHLTSAAAEHARADDTRADRSPHGNADRRWVPATGIQDTDSHADTDYAGTDHAGTDHTSADHAGTDHTSADYAGTYYTSADHTGTDHTGANHTSTDYTGTDHTGANHTSTDYTGTDHTGANHTSTDYTGTDYGNL